MEVNKMKKILALVLASITLLFCFVGCSKIEYNAAILKGSFTFNESWLDSNNELTESKTFVVESQEALNEIFTEFKDVNFDKEMVIVYCYTTIYIREQKLEKVSFDNNVLSIEFDVVDGKPGTGDATAPQTRTCVICLDKVAATEVKITYNGQ